MAADEKIKQIIKVAESNGYKFYCYYLIDPRDESVFYVGKGTKDRIFNHERNVFNGKIQNLSKTVKIREILRECGYVKKQIVAFSNNEFDAYSVERLHIHVHYQNLTNSQPPRINRVEQSKNEAKYCLSQVVPFDLWKRLKNPTEKEIQLYHWAIEKLKRMVKFGAEDQYLITNNQIVQLR